MDFDENFERGQGLHKEQTISFLEGIRGTQTSTMSKSIITCSKTTNQNCMETSQNIDLGARKSPFHFGIIQRVQTSTKHQQWHN